MEMERDLRCTTRYETHKNDNPTTISILSNIHNNWQSRKEKKNWNKLIECEEAKHTKFKLKAGDNELD